MLDWRKGLPRIVSKTSAVLVESGQVDSLKGATLTYGYRAVNPISARRDARHRNKTCEKTSSSLDSWNNGTVHSVSPKAARLDDDQIEPSLARCANEPTNKPGTLGS